MKNLIYNLGNAEDDMLTLSVEDDYTSTDVVYQDTVLFTFNSKDELYSGANILLPDGKQLHIELYDFDIAIFDFPILKVYYDKILMIELSGYEIQKYIDGCIKSLYSAISAIIADLFFMFSYENKYIILIYALIKLILLLVLSNWLYNKERELTLYCSIIILIIDIAIHFPLKIINPIVFLANGISILKFCSTILFMRNEKMLNKIKLYSKLIYQIGVNKKE